MIFQSWVAVHLAGCEQKWLEQKILKEDTYIKPYVESAGSRRGVQADFPWTHTSKYWRFFFLWAPEWEQLTVPVNVLVPQYCQCERAPRSWRQPSNTCLSRRCRTVASDVCVEAIIHRLNSVCSVSGVKLMVFIAIVVVFFFFFFVMIWSHSGTLLLRWCYFSHPVKHCLFHQQMRALWVSTCTPQVSVDSLDHCFYFYLNTI